MKQIVAVLEAVNIGCETSDQVAAVTGLSVATCSAYLTTLAQDGMVRLCRRNWLRNSSGKGRCYSLYAPAISSTN